MALSDRSRLRLAIADRYRAVVSEELGVGNGFATVFQIQLYPVVDTSEALTVDEDAQTRVTDYSIDNGLGLVTFVAAPPREATVRAEIYKWSAFSDDELDDLLDLQVTVGRAAVAALRWVLADSERFVRYFFGQEMVDRTAGVTAINVLLDGLSRAVQAPAGTVRATTTDLEDALAPFIEQEEDLFD